MQARKHLQFSPTRDGVAVKSKQGQWSSSHLASQASSVTSAM